MLSLTVFGHFGPKYGTPSSGIISTTFWPHEIIQVDIRRLLLPSFFVSRFLHFGRFLKLFSSGKKIILRPRKKSRPSDRFSHVVVSRMTEASCSIRPPWNSGSSAERGMAASRPRPAREVPTGTNKPGQKITGISSVRLPSPCSASGQKIFPKQTVLCVPRKGTVRGLVASPRCLPRDRGQLASRPCAARPASGEWGLHARVQAWSDFLARAWADFLGGERALPAPRSWTACLASVGSLPHDCLLHAPREPGLHPCPRACAAHSLPRAGELCLFLASG